jgi:hypothetical protein
MTVDGPPAENSLPKFFVKDLSSVPLFAAVTLSFCRRFMAGASVAPNASPHKTMGDVRAVCSHGRQTVEYDENR